MDDCFRFAVADYCKNHHCPKNVTCVNSRESFMCRCNSLGWTGDQCDKGTRTAVDNLCFITEDLGLNKVKFSRFPCECYFTEVIPPNNIWWLSRSPPPHVFIFQANLSGPPSESFQSLQWLLLLGSQLPFRFPKNQVIPPKFPAPPPAPQAINNDRSLRIKILQNKTHVPLTIVSRGDWLGNPANIKVENNGAAVFVGRSLTVHNPLFFVHKLWLNKLMRCLYWSVSSKWWECYWTLCNVRSKKANKHI